MESTACLAQGLSAKDMSQSLTCAYSHCKTYTAQVSFTSILPTEYLRQKGYKVAFVDAANVLLQHFGKGLFFFTAGSLYGSVFGIACILYSGRL